MTGKIGLEKNGIEAFVAHIPNRRKPALCLQIDGAIYPVASFTSEGRADFFIEVMEEFFGEKM